MNRRITREHEIIRQARIRLGLSQQQVATLVSIQIRQYQRLEYGESDVQKLGMRAGLSFCIVLSLDPYDLIFGAHPETVENLKKHHPVKRGRRSSTGCAQGNDVHTENAPRMMFSPAENSIFHGKTAVQNA